MITRCLTVLFALALSGIIGLAAGASAQAAQVCPARSVDAPPADWSGPGCKTVWAGAVNPTDRLIWVKLDVSAPEMDTGRATGAVSDSTHQLFLSGRFSSRVWLNGAPVGRNGLPGADRLSEAPGLMDVAFTLPDGVVRPGSNEVVLLASAHHSLIDLTRPFHNARIVRTQPGSRRLAAFVAPVMVALGLFLAGGVYFAALAVTARHATGARQDYALLSLLCALASGQLMAEISRTVWAYPYPVQDVRLVAIAGFSAAFGLLSCFYVTRRLRPQNLRTVMAVAALSVVLAIWQQEGFDGKSALAMLGPLCIALAVSIWTWVRPGEPTMRSKARLAAAALTALIVPNLLLPDLFLDAIFFFMVAGFLVLLLVEQVRARSREQAEALRETARADRLQRLLDQLEPVAPPPLVIRSAGRVEQVPVSDITHITGADGYAEIHLSGGRAILHTKSLGALERELPSDFLKVHRSHIVNTSCVSALDRDGSGTGSLVLTDGKRIPVSRRILPRVRQALG
ncbi:MAG: LytTR family DNA-binding domain-containing protein [Litorimonas sp.]